MRHHRWPGSTEEPGGFTPRLWTSTRAGPMAPTMAAPHQQNGHQGTAAGQSPDRPDLAAGPCLATVPPVEAGASRGHGEDLPPAARSASSNASPHPPSPAVFGPRGASWYSSRPSTALRQRPARTPVAAAFHPPRAGSVASVAGSEASGSGSGASRPPRPSLLPKSCWPPPTLAPGATSQEHAPEGVAARSGPREPRYGHERS